MLFSAGVTLPCDAECAAVYWLRRSTWKPLASPVGLIAKRWLVDGNWQVTRLGGKMEKNPALASLRVSP